MPALSFPHLRLQVWVQQNVAVGVDGERVTVGSELCGEKTKRNSEINHEALCGVCTCIVSMLVLTKNTTRMKRSRGKPT